MAKTLREFAVSASTQVAEIEGVRYINDSKATNVDAMKQALETFTEPITLIAGGRDKDGDFEAIASLVHERVHHAVYVGEATSKLERAFASVPSTRAKTLEEAVVVARSHATQEGSSSSLQAARASTCSGTSRNAGRASRRP